MSNLKVIDHRNLPDEKQITLNLDGRERVLRMDLNALADIEDKTGKRAMGGELFSEKMSMSDIRAILWACMRDDDESITLKQVGRMITMDRLADITTAISELVRQSFPAPKEGNANGSGKSDPLLGKKSGR